MIRNLKVLGLALVAVFAMSAVAASGASAANGVVTVSAASNGTGTEIAGGNFLSSFGQTVSCPGSTYDIRKYNVTPHEPVPNNVNTVTVKPTYSSTCSTGEGIKATVHPNGCDFVFHIGETITANGPFGVTADVVCGANEFIDVEVFLSSSNENIKACTLKVTPQTGLTGPELVNGTTSAGKKDITLQGTFNNIHVEETGLCGENTTTTGTFTAHVTITGIDPITGKATDVSVSD